MNDTVLQYARNVPALAQPVLCWTCSGLTGWGLRASINARVPCSRCGAPPMLGRKLEMERPEHTHVRAGNLIWPRSVEDDLPF